MSVKLKCSKNLPKKIKKKKTKKFKAVFHWHLIGLQNTSHDKVCTYACMYALKHNENHAKLKTPDHMPGKRKKSQRIP